MIVGDVVVDGSTLEFVKCACNIYTGSSAWWPGTSGDRTAELETISKISVGKSIGVAMLCSGVRRSETAMSRLCSQVQRVFVAVVVI